MKSTGFDLVFGMLWMHQQNRILINYMSMARDAVGTIPEGMKINVGQESAKYLHGHHNLYEYTHQ